MLSNDLRLQLEEPTPFSDAVKVLLSERNGNVVKVPHSNPAKRARDEFRKLEQDLQDLTLVAKRLDIESRQIQLFSNDNILSFIDALLDISEQIRRTTLLSNSEQKIIEEYHEKWVFMQKEYELKKISAKELELRKKENFEKRDLMLRPINEEVKLERVPDPRRTELAAKVAALCIKYCSDQLEISEDDLQTKILFNEVLDRAKALMDSISGKVKRAHAEKNSKSA